MPRNVGLLCRKTKTKDAPGLKSQKGLPRKVSKQKVVHKDSHEIELILYRTARVVRIVCKYGD